MGVYQDVLEIRVHEWLATGKGNALTIEFAELGEDALPFLFWEFIFQRFA